MDLWNRGVSDSFLSSCQAQSPGASFQQGFRLKPTPHSQHNQSRVSLGRNLTVAEGIQILGYLSWEMNVTRTTFHLVLQCSTSDAGIGPGHQQGWVAVPGSTDKPWEPAHGSAAPPPGQRQQRGPFQTLLPRTRCRIAACGDTIVAGPRPHCRCHPAERWLRSAGKSQPKRED